MTCKKNSIEKLLNTIRQLRGPDGCPWDSKQTPQSISKYLQEETSELLNAIENNDIENICEEIGDVLYILLMLIEIFQDNNQFSYEKTILTINEKLIRRHPHVFAGHVVTGEEELRQQWQLIKKLEKKSNN